MESEKPKLKTKSLEAKAESPSSTSPGRIWLIAQYDKDGYPVIPTYRRGNRTADHYDSGRDDCVEGFYRED